MAQRQRLQRAGGDRRALRQVLELLVDLVHQRQRQLDDARVRLGGGARPIGQRGGARRERRIERELGGLEGGALGAAFLRGIGRVRGVRAGARVQAQVARDLAPWLTGAGLGHCLGTDAGLERGDDVELVVDLRVREDLTRVAPRIDGLADAAGQLHAGVGMREHDQRPGAHLLRGGVARTQVREMVRALHLGVVAVARLVANAQPAHGRRVHGLGRDVALGVVLVGVVRCSSRFGIVAVDALGLRLRPGLRLFLLLAVRHLRDRPRLRLPLQLPAQGSLEIVVHCHTV